MENDKFKQLKSRYEEVQKGLDQLQEEVLARGMELRPGLRRQFDEALRGLFYAMAYADGRIDEREVAFYNYLFEEDLSVTTFELVMAQLNQAARTFEEDLLTAVSTFAQYDKSITGEIPLNAPSLSTLLLSAAETVGTLVMRSDGEVDEDESQSLRRILTDAKQRAELIRSGGESLLVRDGDTPPDEDAKIERDIRGVVRWACASMSELILGAGEIVQKSGVGAIDNRVTAHAQAAAVVVDTVRDELERGKASGDLLILAGAQVKVAKACLRVVRDAQSKVGPGWSDIAEDALTGFSRLVVLREDLDARIRMMREMHDWDRRIDKLETTLDEAWSQFA